MRRSFLIIQTAFTGDVILSTSVAEKLYENNKENTIDILVRKGNEGLFSNHPFINNVLLWNKKKNKYSSLLQILKKIRGKKYDVVINLQRFASTGMLTAFSSAKETAGFNKNPFSFLFTYRIKHIVRIGIHEIDRNQMLIAAYTEGIVARPRLYPSPTDYLNVQLLKKKQYFTIAPGSVWFTKTFPAYKWVELINLYQSHVPGITCYLIGSKDEFNHAEIIKNKSVDKNIENLCGSLSFLESAALMKDAEMNYVNDSAPLHLGGAVNAPVTVVYCSTIPDFGFGPLSDQAKIIQTTLELNCRPCGLHGYNECPMTHFKCAHSIDVTKEFSP